MTDTAVSDRRNFVLMGHTGAGKTTLVDSILHTLGVVNQQGHVDSGTSAADITEEEKERKFTIWAKPFTGTYKTKAGASVKMTMIDTPGYLDFFGQTIAAARVADTALIVVDANAGVAVGAQRAWQLCENQNLPRGIIITGLDRENSDFFHALAAVQEVWGTRCVPVVLPNADLSAEYSVLMSTDVPDDLQERVDDARQQIVEAAAETDDTLIEKYLGGEELTQEELAHGLHTAVNSKSLVPVFAVAGKTEFGLSEVLEAICRYFPSPEEHGVKDAEGKPLDAGPNGPVLRPGLALHQRPLCRQAELCPDLLRHPERRRRDHERHQGPEGEGQRPDRGQRIQAGTGGEGRRGRYRGPAQAARHGYRRQPLRPRPGDPTHRHRLPEPGDLPRRGLRQEGRGRQADERACPRGRGRSHHQGRAQRRDRRPHPGRPGRHPARPRGAAHEEAHQCRGGTADPQGVLPGDRHRPRRKASTGTRSSPAAGASSARCTCGSNPCPPATRSGS